MSNVTGFRPLKFIPLPSSSDPYFSDAHNTPAITLVCCHQCGETVLHKKGKYLSINVDTEQLDHHRHQPGELAWRAYEDETTGEPMTKHAIAHRIARIRKMEKKKGV